MRICSSQLRTGTIDSAQGSATPSLRMPHTIYNGNSMGKKEGYPNDEDWIKFFADSFNSP
jgi:hypothetical protein